MSQAKTRKKSRSNPKSEYSVSGKKTVTIFGGGISGLSAAHELVERGFRVYVWEPADNEREPSAGCDVGGMARTQWGAIGWGEETNPSERQERGWAESSTRPIQHLPWVLYLNGEMKATNGAAPDEPKFLAAIGKTKFAKTEAEIEDVFSEMETFLFGQQDITEDQIIYCEVQQRNALDRTTALNRAKKIVEQLGALTSTRRGIKLDGPTTIPGYAEVTKITARLTGYKPIVFHLAFLDGFPDGLPPAFGERISFRLRERWLPGEHGFRFFPKFYYHLFDTMRRTPILEPVPKGDVATAQERSVTVNANPNKYVENSRTVFDNLRPTENQALGFIKAGLPAILPRRAAKSLKDVRHWLSVIFGKAPEGANVEGGYGLTPRDVALFATKMLQYMTSCEGRREEYGQMTWLEFLGGKQAYSEQFVALVNDSPKALVAMDAEASDARTLGSIFTQLLLDNTDPSGFRDGTLNGPTSVAWLTPWRRYLEAQGVEFIHGRLDGFEELKTPDGKQIIWPKATCFEPRHPGAMELNAAIAPGYFVLALPPLVAQQMAASYLEAASDDERHPDMKRLASMRLADEGDGAKGYPLAIGAAAPTGAMQHMVGIQYYFDQDAYGLDGHYYLPLSPWGISAISQARFWQEKADWEHGYRGVLSVGFTKLNKPGLTGMTTAWQASAPDVAKEVWAQVANALAPNHPENVPAPDYWHLDTNLVKDPKTGVTRNESPLLINLAGEWEKRPGELAAPGPLGWDTDNEAHIGYCVKDGVVLAGNYMKTFTRLTTMEGANESARHAVNAILRDHAAATGSRPELCDIWPLEERELDDFDFLRELDAKLYERELDHFLEILDVQDLVTGTLRGSTAAMSDPTDPLAVLGQLDTIFQGYGGGVVQLMKDKGLLDLLERKVGT